MLLTETSGTWADPLEIDPPADAFSPAQAGLLAVSCSSPNYCASVGFYLTDSFDQDGLMVSQGSVPDMSITQPANITTDATGPNGATVSYPPPAVTDPATATPPAPSCTPASGTVFPIGTTTVTCTAADPGDTNTPVSTTFTVTVTGAGAQLSDLGRAVQGVGIGAGLANTAALIQQELTARHPALACLTLTAFNVQVRLETPKPIPAGTAAQLIADAKQIRSVLAC